MARVSKDLYHRCKCLVKLSGAVFPGFDMKSGVRQGCPIFPLLCILAVGALIRALDHFPPSGTSTRAFADDVGIVLPDAPTNIGRALRVYEDGALFSGVRLNLSKKVVIPLWLTTLQDARSLLARACNLADSLAYAHSGAYLGCAVGPERHKDTWPKAISKCQARAIPWKAARAGFRHGCLIYNT